MGYWSHQRPNPIVEINSAGRIRPAINHPKMSPNNLMDLKSRLDNYRNQLVQDISDANHLVRLQIDGHFKIVQLSIDKTLSIEEIESIMPDLFSRAIDSIAEKIRLKLEDLQAANN